MKFGDLKNGQPFRWQGRLYVKTSPLIGTPQGSGKPRMVARSARVQLADNPGRPQNAEVERRSWHREDVRDAIDSLYHTALDLLSQHARSAESQQALTLARDQTLARLQLDATNPADPG